MNTIRLINNAKWLTPGGEFREGSIEITDDKISRFTEHHSGTPDTKNTLDARGLLVLPGAIDPHVHFREPGQLYKEGIDSGSKAALAGGVTTIIDMPNNKPAISTARRLSRKLELFRRKSHVNWGVMYHTTAHNRDDVAGKIKSAKIYMARSSALPAVTDPAVIKSLFEKFPVVSFHAEDETEFDTTPQRSLLHHENRPRKSITTALFKIESVLKSVPEKKRPRVIICHMNTADEVDWLKRMKNEGFDIWGETCPHYLYFTQDDYITKGTVFQVNPPIRTRADQERLREGLASGIIDFMGTDHAPHTRAEKRSGKPPSGIAAIEWLVPQVLNLIDQNILSWNRYTDIMCAGAARCYKAGGRDGIREGNYADLVLIEHNGQSSNDKIITKAAVNLYEKFNFKWRVHKTLVNGVLKYDNGKIYPEINGREV